MPLNYANDIFKIDISERLCIAVDGSLLRIIRYLPKKKLLLIKRLKLELDSAASSGGEGKLTNFVYFPWPRSTRDYQFQGFVRCLHALGSYCFLFMRSSWFVDLRKKK